MLNKIKLKRFLNPLLIGGVLFGLILIYPSSLTKSPDPSKKITESCQFVVNSENACVKALDQTRMESPDFVLVQSSCLKACPAPFVVEPKVLGALVGSTELYEENLKLEDSKKAIVEYIVEEKDTLSSISEKFAIDLNSLLWANDLAKTASIKPGQKLIVPPVSGVIHYVSSGDIVSKIAQKYQVKSSEIMAFNELSDEADIFIGDVLVVPDGKMPAKIIAQKPSTSYSSASSGLSLPGGYFMCPIPQPCRRTQGLHWNNAVDFSNGHCGDPIYAAASGTVQKAKYGWNKGAGNFINIIHPSGAVTVYYHLQAIYVTPGQTVSKGQKIAAMGGQPGAPGSGLSTGCHLHFGVIGATNPFTR